MYWAYLVSGFTEPLLFDDVLGTHHHVLPLWHPVHQSGRHRHRVLQRRHLGSPVQTAQIFMPGKFYRWDICQCHFCRQTKNTCVTFPVSAIPVYQLYRCVSIASVLFSGLNLPVWHLPVSLLPVNLLCLRNFCQRNFCQCNFCQCNFASESNAVT